MENNEKNLDDLLNFIDGLREPEEEQEFPFDEKPEFIVFNDEFCFLRWNDGVPVVGDWEMAMRFEEESTAVQIAKTLGDGWMVCEEWSEGYEYDP